MEKLKPKGLRIIDPEAVRVVVCTTCCTIVAEDMGRPIDVALVEMAVRSHIDHPGMGLDWGLKYHDLATAIVKEGVSVCGVYLEKEFTD